MSGFEDFDRFCDEHKIQDHELGQAFAAWLNGATGWDGEAEKL
jgi:hypothetical protein